ncbi:unnamed protein product [Gongylonema pulchrum]|uniref:TPR_REGION domain-containing protein n=1 Tax=Gongylonema pulchrum TaxID=637853 RepID=A0A3P7PNL8_9BILA|nr:unnamed protein product [Gongylonema pulchrum]
MCARVAYRRAHTGSGHSPWRQLRWLAGGTGVPLLGFAFMTTFRDMIGIPPFQLDKDPLKHKIKEAWLHRKHHSYEKALAVLEEAMQMAIERNSDLTVSRILDEKANTYYEMGRLDDAEQAFRELLQRLMSLHNKQDSDPEFIEVSLKLSDIFAQKGKLDDAEIGFKHCVLRQMKVVEKHMAKYSITYGGAYDVPQVINQYGDLFTDPLALYGLCLEQYAHFIVSCLSVSYLKYPISHQIYGINCFHTINMLNNYGALLITRNR